MGDRRKQTAAQYGAGERRFEGPPLLVTAALALGGVLLANLISGVYSPGGSKFSAGELWTVAVMLGVWLVALPLAQYLVMRGAGARPRLSWGSWRPNVFGLLRAVEHTFSRRTFVLLCVLPLSTAWVLFPALAALVPGGWGAAPLLGAAAMGASLHFLCYLVPALLRPRGTVVRELEEPGCLDSNEPTNGDRG